MDLARFLFEEMYMKTKLPVGVFAVTVLLLSCTDMVKGKDLADKQVPVFHQLFNEQKFQDIVKAADPDMIKAASGPKIIELLRAIHRKLGPVKESNNINWNIGNFNLETRVVLVQNTSFERGSGTETFTYRVAGGKARLLGYHINSDDLIIK